MDATPPLDDEAVLRSADPGDPRPLVVLLHGYGSDERDLFALVEHLPDAFAYAAVRAPLAPPWPTPGHSWYPIEGLDGRDGGRVTDAAARLIEWVDARVASDAVGLLGFSQGAAVAIQALRLEPARFAFAVNLSGYAAPGPLPGDEALAESRPPVFWGRGSRDEVIPAALVAHTVQWLPDHADLSGRVYTGLTHSVSAQELADVSAFLTKQADRLAGEATG
ncbi:alpha/beta hydrolase [Microbacterium sp. SORGH_AS_0888]|uniref:alpha/beta hydrolase n=1 Tax=Microbacterium sp. SORGH_AS_0888 TaxID=3041791 RepID=UPI00278B9691|nr:alpha/beta hydrolase-fold protein [Microbacterium sp. SORGH_AS_0888]MDQ1129411.1 phospholipase/carboxylesterase [Microbacterium sp. SORGH_AS_0888]